MSKASQEIEKILLVRRKESERRTCDRHQKSYLQRLIKISIQGHTIVAYESYTNQLLPTPILHPTFSVNILLTYKTEISILSVNNKRSKTDPFGRFNSIMLSGEKYALYPNIAFTHAGVAVLPSYDYYLRYNIDNGPSYY